MPGLKRSQLAIEPHAMVLYDKREIKASIIRLEPYLWSGTWRMTTDTMTWKPLKIIGMDRRMKIRLW